ncbi:MAG: hypothetical protein ACYC6Y_15690 [Thermoguttaceae bacterium]
MPTSSSSPATVPMLNAWTIWWNADRLAHGLAGYWNAPIFHPEKGTFAFSEPQPATWVVAPIVWATGTPIPAYHAYLLGTLILNALFAVRLLLALPVRWTAATAGGVAVLLLPLIHQNREAAQLMSVWGVLWTLEALIKHHRRPSPRRGLVLGIAFSTVFLSCIHHGVFLAALLALTGWITIPARRWRPWLAGTGWAVASAAILLLPLAVPMRRILTEHHFARQASRVQSLSATASDWLQTEPQGLTDFPLAGRRSARPLLPGWIRAGLALVGAALSMRPARRRRAVLFLLAWGCAALVASLGMNLSLAGWQPWLTLRDWLPGFSLVRSAYRFAYFAQLAIVLLAAVGLDRMRSFRPARKRPPTAHWLARVLFVAASALVAFEVPPAPVPVVAVPDVSQEPQWSAWLRQHTPAGRAIVCLPFATDYTAQGCEPTGRWMLYATRHRVPMVNGYSGYFPKSWYRMVEAFEDLPFSESTLDLLADAGVEFVLVDTTKLPAVKSPGEASERHQLVHLLSDETGVEIWEIVTISR